MRPNGRVSEEKRCGLAQSSPVANIWMKKVSAPLTRKNLVGNHSRIAERLLYERMRLGDMEECTVRTSFISRSARSPNIIK